MPGRFFQIGPATAEPTRLGLTHGTSAPPLREDTERIDIMNERGLIETALPAQTPD